MGTYVEIIVLWMANTTINDSSCIEEMMKSMSEFSSLTGFLIHVREENLVGHYQVIQTGRILCGDFSGQQLQ